LGNDLLERTVKNVGPKRISFMKVEVLEYFQSENISRHGILAVDSHKSFTRNRFTGSVWIVIEFISL